MQTELLNVTGMTCGGCVGNITKALKAIEGVGDIKVSLPTGEVTVQYDQRLASIEQFKSAVRRAGYGVDANNAIQSPKAKGCCCG
ncbi:MAG: heavy-metal-associated domain-containing protein [Burkholderiales bacterium]|nr:heavy-metal-associated domain-containing protein [Burkholderiales bacterium]